MKAMQGARFAHRTQPSPPEGQPYNLSDQTVAATCGHSIVGVYGPGRRVTPDEVPAVLVHGTEKKSAPGILEGGLICISRPIHLREPELPKWKTDYEYKITVQARLSATQGGVRYWKCDYNDVWLALDRIRPNFVTASEPWQADDFHRVAVPADEPPSDVEMSLAVHEVSDLDSASESCAPSASVSSRAAPPVLPRPVFPSSVPQKTLFGDLDFEKVKSLEGDMFGGQEAEAFEISRGLEAYLADSDDDVNADLVTIDEPSITEMAAVVQWRQDSGLVRDSDFAFAFCSAEEAAAHSNAMLLTWRAVRHSEMSSVGSQASTLLERASSSASSTPTPGLAAKARPKPKGPTEAQLRAREKGQDADYEAKRAAASHLIDWVRVLPLHPWVVSAAGAKFSDAEFEEFLYRRSKVLCSFELRCLRSALLALQRLHGHRSAGLQAAWGNALVVDEYLATLAKPHSTFVALRWCERHLMMQFDMSQLRCPTTSSGTVGCASKQAVACEPKMIFGLGALVKRLLRDGDRRWLSLVVGHIMQSGVMRRRHLQRSRLLRLTSTTAFFWCAKGKTGGRQGFPWSCPSHSVDGVPVLKLWADSRQLVEKTTGKDIHYVCFDLETGDPLAMSAITAGWRSVFTEVVSNAELLTSYSFRRVATTLASAVHLPWELRLALGAWQGDVTSAPQPQAQRISLMPARYADNRDAIQAITKLSCQLVMQDLQSKACHTWQTSLSTLAKVDMASVMAAAAELYEDSDVVIMVEESDVRRFKLLEESESESLTVEDEADEEASVPEPAASSAKAPAPTLPVAGRSPLVYWSMAKGSTAIVHFHWAAWEPTDPESTPLCRLRHRSAAPLRRPLIVGVGWQSAMDGGPICPDCAKAVDLDRLKASGAKVPPAASPAE